MAKVRRHYILKGRVQGVGFRYKAYHTARAYGLTGYARNLYDGSVELEVQGDVDVIRQFLTLLDEDRYIRIADMEMKEMPLDEEERSFRIEY